MVSGAVYSTRDIINRTIYSNNILFKFRWNMRIAKMNEYILSSNGALAQNYSGGKLLKWKIGNKSKKI